MDKIFSLAQLVLACIIFLCVMTCVTALIITGNIKSFPGYLVSLGFTCLALVLVRLSWKEYLEERHK